MLAHHPPCAVSAPSARAWPRTRGGVLQGHPSWRWRTLPSKGLSTWPAGLAGPRRPRWTAGSWPAAGATTRGSNLQPHSLKEHGSARVLGQKEECISPDQHYTADSICTQHQGGDFTNDATFKQCEVWYGWSIAYQAANPEWSFRMRAWTPPVRVHTMFT